MKKSIFFITAFSILIIFTLTSYCIENLNYDASSFKDMPAGEYELSDPSGISVKFIAKSKSFEVTDGYGYVWNSIVTNEIYDYGLINTFWEENVNSILTIEYADISSVNPSVQTEYSTKADVKASKKDGDLILAINYPVSDITVFLHVTIDNGNLAFRIPSKEIKENSKYSLISIDLLPYFGACKEEESGYMVYPDGSGALKYHKSMASSTIRNTSYSWSIYGEEFDTVDAISEQGSSEIMAASLPVFGIKKADHAFISFSTEGETESVINMFPSGASLNLNRMFFKFRYRTNYDIAMSNININGNNIGKNINGKMYSKNMIKVDHEVRFGFLKGDDSDYSGMAVAYREYLIKNRLIKPSGLLGNTNLNIDIFMGASEKNNSNSGVVSTTNISQAKTIIDELTSSGYKDVLYNLTGWSKGGYGVYPQSLNIDPAFGSEKDLISLLNKYSNLTLRFDLINANSGNGGFSPKSDTIKKGNQSYVTDFSEKAFLLNSNKIQNRFSSVMAAYKTAQRSGISFERIGKLLYRDESGKNNKNKEEMKGIFNEILEQSSKKGVTAVEGSNLYCLKYADLIFDLPESSSEYFISDLSIPFTQIVLHGSLLYTGKAGNLASDYQNQLLRWIEYGYVPNFEITYENSDVLKNTNYSELFTSQYKSHLKKLKEAYSLYKNKLSMLEKSYIMEHTAISPDFVSVKYSNGITVLINYSSVEKQYNGHIVAAENFILLEDGQK